MPNPSLLPFTFAAFPALRPAGFVIARVNERRASSNPLKDGRFCLMGTGLDGWKPSRENTQFEVIRQSDRPFKACGSTNFLSNGEKSTADFELELEIKIDDIDLNSAFRIRTRLTTAERTKEITAVPSMDPGRPGEITGRSGHIFAASE